MTERWWFHGQRQKNRRKKSIWDIKTTRVCFLMCWAWNKSRKCWSTAAELSNSEAPLRVTPSSSETHSRGLLHLPHLVTPPFRQLSKLQSSQLLWTPFAHSFQHPIRPIFKLPNLNKRHIIFSCKKTSSLRLLPFSLTESDALSQLFLKTTALIRFL